MTANSMRRMFGRLGFVAPGPEMLVVDQGINRIDELSDLDDAVIDAFLKLLRRPGGIIPNPNAAVEGQTARITAPGISVSMRAATHLKLSVYYCRHQMRKSCPLRTTDITLPRIKALKNLREEEEYAIDPLLPQKVDVKNWSNTLEAIQEWISMYQGIKKAPLSYVIQTNIEPLTTRLILHISSRVQNIPHIRRKLRLARQFTITFQQLSQLIMPSISRLFGN